MSSFRTEISPELLVTLQKVQLQHSILVDVARDIPLVTVFLAVAEGKVSFQDGMWIYYAKQESRPWYVRCANWVDRFLNGNEWVE